MSYLRIITDYYELLRCIYGKIPRFVTSCHGELRATYGHFTTCLRVVTNSYELVRSIYESLRLCDKKYINPSNLNVLSFDN